VALDSGSRAVQTRPSGPSARWLLFFTPNSTTAGGPDGLVCTARLPLSSATLNCLADLIRGHLKKIGSRWRALSAGKIAGIVLAVLHCDQRPGDLAGGNGIHRTTVTRWVREVVGLLLRFADVGDCWSVWLYCWEMRYPDGGGLTAVQRAVRERVRFEAAEMFGQGVGPPVVAKRLRVSRKSAYAWHAAWCEGGVKALRSKGPSGRPSRMKPAWRAWLEQALEQGPAGHGWVEDQRWTLARIALLIARRFHVGFSIA